MVWLGLSGLSSTLRRACSREHLSLQEQKAHEVARSPARGQFGAEPSSPADACVRCALVGPWNQGLTISQ